MRLPPVTSAVGILIDILFNVDARENYLDANLLRIMWEIGMCIKYSVILILFAVDTAVVIRAYNLESIFVSLQFVPWDVFVWLRLELDELVNIHIGCRQLQILVLFTGKLLWQLNYIPVLIKK
jgi:hypothetical protein